MCSRSMWHPYANGATGRCTAFGCDGTFKQSSRRGCAVVLIAGVALAAALATDPTVTLAALATAGVAR